MGRIKTVLAKRVTKDLIRKYPEEFSEDFDQNKVALSKRADIKSQKMRNVVAGYASRLIKKAKSGSKESRKTTPEDISKFY